MSIVSTKELNLSYGKHHVLKDVSMDIERNEITALIGPSGCGKSTFLKTLNRMNDLVPDCHITGQVLFEGTDIYSRKVDAAALRKKVGMVFQKANPFPASIYDNIAYAPKYHGVRGRKKLDEIVETSLRKAALWDEVKDRLKKSALGLPGGQQQRLCIARTIAQAQEGAAVLTVGIDAEAFEAETLVVGDGAFEVRGRNADMLDAGDGVANGHGDSSEQDGFAGIERQSHRENGVGVDYLPISAR